MYSGQTKKGEEKEARRKNGGNGNRKNGKEQELDLAADSSFITASSLPSTLERGSFTKSPCPFPPLAGSPRQLCPRAH